MFNTNVDVNDLTNDAKISFAKNGFNYWEVLNLQLTAPEEHRPAGTKSKECWLQSVLLFPRAVWLQLPLLGNERSGIALPVFRTRGFVTNLRDRVFKWLSKRKEWIACEWFNVCWPSWEFLKCLVVLIHEYMVNPPVLPPLSQLLL